LVDKGVGGFHASSKLAVLDVFGVLWAGPEGLFEAQNEEWIWITFQS
jgi:hypothetical protein